MKVIFLGTNGWYATQTGNTACVLLKTEHFDIVFDAGDGLYKLDQYVDFKKPIWLFLSHCHLDHIIGLHVLNKFKQRGYLNIVGLPGIRQVMRQFIATPYTTPVGNVSLNVMVRGIDEGVRGLGHGLRMTCVRLDHSTATYGYRVEVDGRVVAYCTDTAPCENARLLAKGADLLIHDCNVKNLQYPPDHSGPREAARVAKEAQVKSLVLFHFAPNIYSAEDRVFYAARYAQEIFPETAASYDGLEINL